MIGRDAAEAGGRHPGYDADACQHSECRPDAAVPIPWQQGPDAAQAWIAGLAERMPELLHLAAADREMPGRWTEMLGQNEWLRANAWTAAHGDTEQAREVRDDMRRRAALLFAVEAVARHVRYRRRAARSTRYAGAEWVEPHVGPVLDRMAEAATVAEVYGMLPGLRQAAAAAMGEQVASALDPFVPVAVR